MFALLTLAAARGDEAFAERWERDLSTLEHLLEERSARTVATPSPTLVATPSPTLSNMDNLLSKQDYVDMFKNDEECKRPALMFDHRCTSLFLILKKHLAPAIARFGIPTADLMKMTAYELVVIFDTLTGQGGSGSNNGGSGSINGGSGGSGSNNGSGGSGSINGGSGSGSGSGSNNGGSGSNNGGSGSINSGSGGSGSNNSGSGGSGSNNGGSGHGHMAPDPAQHGPTRPHDPAHGPAQEPLAIHTGPHDPAHGPAQEPLAPIHTGGHPHPAGLPAGPAPLQPAGPGHHDPPAGPGPHHGPAEGPHAHGPAEGPNAHGPGARLARLLYELQGLQGCDGEEQEDDNGDCCAASFLGMTSDYKFVCCEAEVQMEDNGACPEVPRQGRKVCCRSCCEKYTWQDCSGQCSGRRRIDVGSW